MSSRWGWLIICCNIACVVALASLVLERLLMVSNNSKSLYSVAVKIMAISLVLITAPVKMAPLRLQSLRLAWRKSAPEKLLDDISALERSDFCKSAAAKLNCERFFAEKSTRCRKNHPDYWYYYLADSF